MSPLLHSSVIKNEHKKYIDNFEKLIRRRLTKSNKKLSFDYYKMSYSIFVLISELIRKRKGTVFLKELKTEIVTLISLGTLGFEISLHLRRCIELALKHVYYFDHPIEYQILLESFKSSEMTKQDRTVRDLFSYLLMHPNLKKLKELNNPVNLIDNSYQNLCEIVHARKIPIPSKLEECTLPRLTKEEIQQAKKTYRQIVRSIIVLLITFHIKSAANFDGYKKELILYSLNPALSRNVRTTLSI